jgi:hypothetical protein
LLSCGSCTKKVPVAKLWFLYEEGACRTLLSFLRNYRFGWPVRKHCRQTEKHCM